MTKVQSVSEKSLPFSPVYSFFCYCSPVYGHTQWFARIVAERRSASSPGVTPRDQPWPVGLKAGTCGRSNSREGHRGLRTFRLSGYSVALLINVRLINCRLINGPADQ